jgi:hypothetical protein
MKKFLKKFIYIMSGWELTKYRTEDEVYIEWMNTSKELWTEFIQFVLSPLYYFKK